MRIIVTVDPEIPVPPRFYGGIERIVDLLVCELMNRGHEVTLFAHPESSVRCELIGWPGKSSLSHADTLRNMTALTSYLAKQRGRDDVVVHSFARLAYLLPLLGLPIPKLQTYQRKVTARSSVWGNRLARGTLWFTACSRNCASTGDRAGTWHVVYNGVPLDRYDFVAQPPVDAPLVFLGRIEPIKGTHHAIEVARRSGRRLIIAGNVPDREPERSWAQQLLRNCVGGQIEYAGPVDDAAKNELLGNAACLLFPIEWEEPFGIVMAEALACGAPVIGMRRGSVPEVVEHGRTGFVCDSLDDMVAAVGALERIDRARCREAAERRFASSVVADDYERLYRQLLASVRS